MSLRGNMRALTLTQPWAGLVASGIKLVENRPRSMIKREDFGKPFAIHASREIDERVYARIREIDPALIDYQRDDGPHREQVRWYRLSRITSAVIAVATISDIVVDRRCVSVGVDDDGHCKRCGLMPVDDDDGPTYCPSGFTAGTRDPSTLAQDQRRWFFGPVGYVLRDVIALPTPVQCKGALGFWTLPADVEANVREQLGAMP